MPIKSIQWLYREAKKYLADSSVDDIDLTVLFIIQHVFSSSYVELVSHDVSVDCDQERQVFSLLEACKLGHPLAYVLGLAGFNGREYAIQPGVLIPRPETEGLVASARAVIGAIYSNNLVVFECGLGSGVVSLELAYIFSDVTFIGWDISSDAVDTSRINMQRMGVSNLMIEHGDFFSLSQAHDALSSCRVLVSNPPYVSLADYAHLDDHVRQEPMAALVAPDNGLAIIFQLIDFAIQHGVILICEIGSDQRALILEAYSQARLFFSKDLSGHDRYLFYFPNCDLVSQKLIDELGIF